MTGYNPKNIHALLLYLVSRQLDTSFHWIYLMSLLIFFEIFDPVPATNGEGYG